MQYIWNLTQHSIPHWEAGTGHGDCNSAQVGTAQKKKGQRKSTLWVIKSSLLSPTGMPRHTPSHAAGLHKTLCVCTDTHFQGCLHDPHEHACPMAWGTGACVVLTGVKQVLSYSSPCWLACQSQMCLHASVCSHPQNVFSLLDPSNYMTDCAWT